jgi:hypothetical protein
MAYRVIKINSFVDTGLVKPSNIDSYHPREEQFTNGSPTRQNEILNMMINPGIIKGIKNQPGIRYVVDCFKSFVEAGYKYQYGELMISLDEANKFVRTIINEIFLEDFVKSTNPLFKDSPEGTFKWDYVPEGGNKNYSSKLLTKFTRGAEFCFFFGPGTKVGSIVKGLSGQISNLFYGKDMAFDVIANQTGYLDGVTELEDSIDDNERAFAEKFRYNPIIFFDGGFTIFGNRTGQKVKSALQEIHGSELLAYIKENLWNLSKRETFKKGNYDDYLRLETESQNFMNDLSFAGAIEPNPIVICNSSNNTKEIQDQRIKLVHIEYTQIGVYDKIVFDLQIN